MTRLSKQDDLVARARALDHAALDKLWADRSRMAVLLRAYRRDLCDMRNFVHATSEQIASINRVIAEIDALVEMDARADTR